MHSSDTRRTAYFGSIIGFSHGLEDRSLKWPALCGRSKIGNCECSVTSASHALIGNAHDSKKIGTRGRDLKAVLEERDSSTNHLDVRGIRPWCCVLDSVKSVRLRRKRMPAYSPIGQVERVCM